MRRKLVALSLLLCACGGASAQPEPFHTEILAMDLSVIASADVLGDSVLLLRSGTQQFRLPPPVFEAIADAYIGFRKTSGASQLEVGLHRGNFVFAFELRAILLGLISMGAIVLLGGLGIRAWYRRRLRRLSIEQARLFEQRRFVAQGQEQERQRLARELHDGPLQSLYALRMQLARRSPDLEAQDASISQIAEHLRSVATALRSPLLAPFGLSSALQDLSLTYPGTEVAPEIDEDAELLLDERTRNTLFRIAQEATSNAVRHGHATRITLRLLCDRNQIRMMIQDNGSGFDATIPVETYAGAGHYGLVGMRERVEVLGGTIRLQSDASGTRVELVLPIAPSMPPVSMGDGASSMQEAQAFL